MNCDTEVKCKIRDAFKRMVLSLRYKNVSMDHLASEVGMSKKTIYQHYGNKNELFSNVVDYLISENTAMAQSAALHAENAIEEILLCSDYFFKTLDSFNDEFLQDIQKILPQEYNKIQQHLQQVVLSVISNNLKRGIEEGLYRPEINIPVLSLFRLNSTFKVIDDSFTKAVNQTWLQAQKEITLHFLYGILLPKGFHVLKKILQHKRISTYAAV